MLNRHRSLTGFFKGTDGSATIEAVLWTPAFFALVMLVADVSMIFNGQARMLRIVQDANRSLSVGRVLTAAEVEATVKEKVANIDANAVVKTTVVDGLITTTLTIPADKLDLLGWFSVLRQASVKVSAQHYVEY